MKLSKIRAHVLLLGAVVAIAIPPGSANCAEDEKATPPKVTIKFKIFDTNNVNKPLHPPEKSRALVYARIPGTPKALPLEQPEVTFPKEKDGLYEIQVSPGWLIEQLVIEVDDPQREYNPAIVTKVVSKADMTIYPGASKSKDPFSFQSYTAQMGAYRALLTELLDGQDRTEQERRRSILRIRFEKQLLEMAKVNERVSTENAEEKTAARKLANEVLRLYGLPFEEETTPTPPCPIVSQPYVECYFVARCRLFGRWRR